jgi:hypothetical protein
LALIAHRSSGAAALVDRRKDWQRRSLQHVQGMGRDRCAPLVVLLAAAIACCAPALQGADAVTAAAAVTPAAASAAALINATQCEWDAAAQSCGLSGGG